MLIEKNNNLPNKRLEETKSILYLGRIHPKKGLDLAINAWSNIEDKFPNWRFDIIGKGDLYYINLLKQEIAKRNLKRIKLAKKYSKKRAELKKIIKNKKLELSERFAAQLKLNKLPKNSSKIRIRNR